MTDKASNLKTGRRIARNRSHESLAEECRTKAIEALKIPKSGLAAKLNASKEKSVATTAPHVIVKALAGTGKTTTLIEGLKRVKGLPTTITPSPQQASVWDSMELSRDAVSIGFCAFNKSIASELQSRVPAGCDAMTIHSLGFKAVNRAFGRVAVNSYRVQDIIAEILERDIREIRRNDPVLVKATEDLVGLCKMNLSHIDGCGNQLAPGGGDWPEVLTDLAEEYDIDLNSSRLRVFELVPKVLERCRDVTRDNSIDFNDMIWIPVALNLPVQQYDLLLVDESQDLCRCQQYLAKRAGRRLILCGDENQAIYQFAGADSQSMARMETELKASLAGCVVLPLTVTRRCGKAIVDHARKLVPNFEAHESNPEGKVSHARYTSEMTVEVRDPSRPTTHSEPDTYHRLVRDGDMIICRCNAPLVSQLFRFLKAGRKATIQGRDIAKGLISTVKRMTKDSNSIPQFIRTLSEWLSHEMQKEQAKKNPNENRMIALQDRYDCLICFTDGLSSCAALIDRIDSIFTDEKNGKGITLSSVHRAKGLERDRVFFLMPKGAECPHPMARTPQARQSEKCVRYVGETRAIHELIFVQ